MENLLKYSRGNIDLVVDTIDPFYPLKAAVMYDVTNFTECTILVNLPELR